MDLAVLIANTLANINVSAPLVKVGDSLQMVTSGRASVLSASYISVPLVPSMTHDTQQVFNNCEANEQIVITHLMSGGNSNACP